MKIAHVINIFKCDINNKSYLYHAIPITINSMNKARIEAKKKKLEVELFASFFKEDENIIPNFFKKLPYLNRSTKSQYKLNRKLPFIEDILKNLFNNTDAEYLIYTNVDIGLQKNFYLSVSNFLKDYDSLIINRRDNIPKFYDGKRLTYKNLGIIYNLKGEDHPGWDCFIFKRNYINKINLKNLFIGYPPWGFLLKKQLEIFSKKFKVLKKEFLTFHIGNDLSWNDYLINNLSNNLLRINLKNSQIIFDYLKKNKLIDTDIKDILLYIENIDK